MLIIYKNKIIRKYSTDPSYNTCRSCKNSIVSPTTQGDYVTCAFDGKYPELGLNKNNDCKEYKRAFNWLLR